MLIYNLTKRQQSPSACFIPSRIYLENATVFFILLPHHRNYPTRPVLNFCVISLFKRLRVNALTALTIIVGEISASEVRGGNLIKQRLFKSRGLVFFEELPCTELPEVFAGFGEVFVSQFHLDPPQPEPALLHIEENDSLGLAEWMHALLM